MSSLRRLASCMLGCLFAAGAQATPLVYEPPDPTLFPRFGTLIDFNDQPALTPVVSNGYAGRGLLSIDSVEPLPFGEFLYYPSPFGGNYIGTGAFGERDFGVDPTDTDPSGFDGTILFRFASPQSVVGVDITETPGAALPVLRAYDSSMNLLEDFIAPFGSNAVVYAGFHRNADIRYLEVRGDGFALDNLQFSVPEPGTIDILGLAVLALFGSRKIARRNQERDAKVGS